MWQAGVKCDRRAAGNTERNRGPGLRMLQPALDGRPDGRTHRQRNNEKKKKTQWGRRERQYETGTETEEDTQFGETKRRPRAYFCTNAHRYSYKTHTGAIKQPSSLAPATLCRGRAARLFPHHSASVESSVESSVDHSSARGSPPWSTSESANFTHLQHPRAELPNTWITFTAKSLNL